MAYVGTAYTVMADMVMIYVVMANIVMAYIFMACSYDKETMFLREVYMMNVPLAMPSPALYVQWFADGHNVCAQRINWMNVRTFAWI